MIKPMKTTTCLSVLAALLFCTLPAQAAPQVAYFVGSSSTMSPDGKRAYGPPRSVVVKRITSPSKGQITEVVHHQGKLHLTLLKRIAKSRQFVAFDKKGTFLGILSFRGKAWKWTQWRYAISMRSGKGVIVGKGKLGASGLSTIKYFVTPDGVRRVRIIETLKLVSQKAYQKALRQQTHTKPNKR